METPTDDTKLLSPNPKPLTRRQAREKEIAATEAKLAKLKAEQETDKDEREQVMTEEVQPEIIELLSDSDTEQPSVTHTRMRTAARRATSSAPTIPAEHMAVLRDSMSPFTPSPSPVAETQPERQTQSMDVEAVDETVVKTEEPDDAMDAGVVAAHTPKPASNRKKPAARSRKSKKDVVPKVEVKEELIEAQFSIPGSEEPVVGHFKVTDKGIMKYEDDDNVPEIDVPEEYSKTWTRDENTHVFGGGKVVTFHHEKATSKPGPAATGGHKEPFGTLSLKWHASGPRSPGKHGIIVGGVSQVYTWPEPIVIFFRVASNKWMLMGRYDYRTCGSMTPEGVRNLPESVLTTWSRGFLTKKWGQDAIAYVNEELEEARQIQADSLASIKEALCDGRLELDFTVLKCVGYPYDWFEKLRNNGDRAVTPKNEVKEEQDEEMLGEQSKKRKAASVAGGRPRKRANTGPSKPKTRSSRGKSRGAAANGRRAKRDMNWEDDEDESGGEDVEIDSDGDYAPQTSLHVTSGGKRTSPRKAAKA
ncbi:hypothetical protein HMN09_00545100 [Mycena chlorophos]|uniref:DUF6697 domain-containing protein n=1 Tax=Mycena chlorophos TaxID=658473 RepID=A0A8H6WCQ6_MYCCL|nr:hypothetical protein HMN09_00545100 [Mycena chlorophos]